ncbi:MAG: hypothetical protein E7016_07740 [Alphaproteobacteria bacterium]|nr:hypothetical protein [Alphaproteobacteria bacterium]
MRKYFLLSAAAILAANTANAATAAGVATVQVSAEVTPVSTVSCTELKFGNILLESDWTSFVIDTDRGCGAQCGTDVIDVIGHQNASCTFSTVNVDDYNDATVSVPSGVTLSGDNGRTLTVGIEPFGGNEIMGTIDEDVEVFDGGPSGIFGKYSGSFIATLVY